MKPARLLAALALLLACAAPARADETSAARRFEQAQRDEPSLIAFLQNFPKGADLHNHLNGALYSETGQHWQGEELWRAIKAIPIAERVQDPVGDSGLPPLYPK